MCKMHRVLLALLFLILIKQNRLQLPPPPEPTEAPFVIPDDQYYCYYLNNSKILNSPQKFKQNCITQFSCWESQLTDTNRVILTDAFNDYKRTVAAGTCPQCKGSSHRNVFKMDYHWYMEFLSIFIHESAGCPFLTDYYFDDILTEHMPYDVGYNYGTFEYKDYQTYAYASTSLLLRDEEYRDAAINKIPKILTNVQKADIFLQQFQKNPTRYMFGKASIFGCSISVRDGVTGVTGMGEHAQYERVAFLSCLFAARGQFIETYPGSTDPDSCRNYHEAAAYNLTDGLCYYAQDDRKRRWDIPCQLYYNVETPEIESLFTKCDEDVPQNWLQLRSPDFRYSSIIVQIHEDNIINVSYLLPATPSPHNPYDDTTTHKIDFSAAPTLIKNYVLIFYTVLTLTWLQILVGLYV